jgi:hypothetical protein
MSEATHHTVTTERLFSISTISTRGFEKAAAWRFSFFSAIHAFSKRGGPLTFIAHGFMSQSAFFAFGPRKWDFLPFGKMDRGLIDEHYNDK